MKVWMMGEDLKNDRINKEGEDKQRREEHTRLVIDEDSIYEIDLDCLACMEKDKKK